MSQPASVLLIYTGGTIGMLADPRSGTLRPMDLSHLEDQVPELERVNVRLESVAFEKPIDSSDMRPDGLAADRADHRGSLRGVRRFRGAAR
jgi:L-asparaginase